jgi:hypothetical protein
VYSVTAAFHFWGSILGATREYAVLGGGDGSRIWTKPLEIPSLICLHVASCRPRGTATCVSPVAS